MLRFGAYELVPARFELRRGDEVVPVEPQVFDVLAYLVAHRDRVVTKEELLDEVWGDRFVSESALTSRLKAARRAVGDDGTRQAVIKTIHGRGYRFVAPVTEVGPAGDRAPAPSGPPAGTAAPISYARSGQLNIAFQVTGAGRPDILLVPGFVSHLQLDWSEPRHAHFLDRLGTMGRLIRFDKRGTGLSDRPHGVPDLETRMDDVRAVLDAAGSERAVLFGYSEGGPMAVLFAATYPERTTGLVLYGTYARRLWAPDYPWGATPELRARYAEQLEHEWGWEADMRAMCPSADEAMAQWWGMRCRAAASPGAARALIEMNSLVDVRDVLPSVHPPTLVLHRSHDRDSQVDEGRFIAERIPRATFVELPGVDHFVAVDPDQILDRVETFLAHLAPAGGVRSLLTTVLAAAASGPVDRGELAGLVAPLLGRHGGLPARSSEAGVLATFDGPGRAVRCAVELVRRAADGGWELAAGVHTAEVTLVDGVLQGEGVGTAVAIAAAAPLGAVWVSDTTRGLVSGTDLQFSAGAPIAATPDRPVHEVV